MDKPTRRDFLRDASLLTGAAFAWGTVPEAVARAFAIDPEPGSTFLDAEHIVVLMQENRSFDHCYGSLRGVRGFRDPRPHLQPDGQPVWFQTDAQGHTFKPFRLDMKGSNVTWIGGLPHSWADQVDAMNGGQYDKWLIAKPRKEFPFTLGFYARKDIPFYYALADAFTVCDQTFCSSLTGTTPNRLYLWSGTIRKDAQDTARVVNSDTDYGAEADWTTFPERLEDAGVTWKVYQNEINLTSGLDGDEDNWLANFSDNPLEWMSQYKVRFAASRRAYVAETLAKGPSWISELETKVAQATDKAKAEDELAKAKALLAELKVEAVEYSEEAWQALDARSRGLHERAFTVNRHDPDYRTLVPMTYDEGGQERSLSVPKGDVLSGFRNDVHSGNLPAVSWIVAPCAFSDHPGSAWFGAWYVSEVMNILTQNPEVWKKTIFVLCYDENDGYFDHVPPFIAPFPDQPETGKTTPSIDTSLDVATAHGRTHSIGLGYRCPLVVVSPWSRGGAVNSQVFDNTSVIQLIETWLNGKGKDVRETNISSWRRAICGDLSSCFKPYQGESYGRPEALDRDETIKAIFNAKYMSPPAKVEPLSPSGMKLPDISRLQEPGTRPSCPLPYDLHVNAQHAHGVLQITMGVGKQFGKKGVGAPFSLFSYAGETFVHRSYAARPGESVTDSLEVSGPYHVRVAGPNGFLREFRGSPADPLVKITSRAEKYLLTFEVDNLSQTSIEIMARDLSYGGGTKTLVLKPGAKGSFKVNTGGQKGWYDQELRTGSLAYRYAGRLETGQWSISDPAMG